MNTLQFLFSLILFICIAKVSFEVWFAPKKFLKMVDAYRNSFKSFLGFSYWKNGSVSWPLVKIVSIFLLIGTLLSLIVSTTGPIIY